MFYKLQFGGFVLKNKYFQKSFIFLLMFFSSLHFCSVALADCQYSDEYYKKGAEAEKAKDLVNALKWYQSSVDFGGTAAKEKLFQLVETKKLIPETEGKPITVQGLLRSGFTAPGGETTGWFMALDQPVTFDPQVILERIEIAKEKLTPEMSQKYSLVTGVIHWVHGNQLGYRILIVPDQIQEIKISGEEAFKMFSKVWQGDGTPQPAFKIDWNFTLAKDWCQISANEGYSFGLYQLICYYAKTDSFSGRKGDRDLGLARHLFEKASQEGMKTNDQALLSCLVGMRCRDIHDFDKTEIANWLIQHGDKDKAAQAAGVLASFYEIDKNIDLAKKFYQEEWILNGKLGMAADVKRLNIAGTPVTVVGIINAPMGFGGPGYWIHLDQPVTVALWDNKVFTSFGLSGLTRNQSPSFVNKAFRMVGELYWATGMVEAPAQMVLVPKQWKEIPIVSKQIALDLVGRSDDPMNIMLSFKHDVSNSDETYWIKQFSSYGLVQKQKGPSYDHVYYLTLSDKSTLDEVINLLSKSIVMHWVDNAKLPENLIIETKSVPIAVRPTDTPNTDIHSLSSYPSLANDRKNKVFYVPIEMIVVLKKDLSESEVERVRQKMESLGKVRINQWQGRGQVVDYQIYINPDKIQNEVVDYLKADPAVAGAEPEYLFGH